MIRWEVVMNTIKDNFSRTLYFGLSVEVVQSMESCSLIRFSGHEVIVDASDLIIEPGIRIESMERCSSDSLHSRAHQTPLHKTPPETQTRIRSMAVS
jgi:hypothetical protein